MFYVHSLRVRAMQPRPTDRASSFFALKATTALPVSSSIKKCRALVVSHS